MCSFCVVLCSLGTTLQLNSSRHVFLSFTEKHPTNQQKHSIYSDTSRCASLHCLSLHFSKINYTMPCSVVSCSYTTLHTSLLCCRYTTLHHNTTLLCCSYTTLHHNTTLLCCSYTTLLPQPTLNSSISNFSPLAPSRQHWSLVGGLRLG